MNQPNPLTTAQDYRRASKAFRKQRQYCEAAEHAERGLVLARDSKDSIEIVKSLGELGTALTLVGKQDEVERAIMLLEESIALAPLNPAGQGQLAAACIKRNTPESLERAILAAQEQIQLSPDDVYGYGHLASAYLKRGRSEDVPQILQAGKEYVRRKPHDSVGYGYVFEAQLRGKDYGEATKTLSDLNRASPDNAYLPWFRIRLWLAQGKFDHAASEAREVPKTLVAEHHLNRRMLELYRTMVAHGVGELHDYKQCLAGCKGQLLHGEYVRYELSEDQITFAPQALVDMQSLDDELLGDRGKVARSHISDSNLRNLRGIDRTADTVVNNPGDVSEHPAGSPLGRRIKGRQGKG